jgi:hypothetical protein
VLANAEYADWLLFNVPDARGRIAFDGRWEILSKRRFEDAMRFLHQQGADWSRAGRGYRLLVLDPKTDGDLVATFERRHVRELYRDRRLVVFDRGSGA